MKIAILAPTLRKQDYDFQIKRYLKEFTKESDEITIFALDADISFDNARLCIIGMPKNLLFQRIYRLTFPLDFIKTLMWLPKLRKFDLIISHLYPMNWLAFLSKKLYKIEYIYWYHGIPSLQYYPKLYEKFYLKLFLFLTKITVQNVDQAFAISKFAQKELKKYTGLDSKLIYCTVDKKKFNKNINGSIIRDKLSLDNNQVILNVARITPLKGAHLLIESFKIIKQKLPNVKLVIVGEHTHSYYTQKLIENSDDSVIFTGPISNEVIPLYYAMCDIYATCTVWETFNVPIAEAQACGRPVVAFNIGPHPEVIDENGILVEEGNVEEFAKACINKLLEVRGDTVEHNRKEL